MPPMDESSREAILDREVQNYVRRGYRVVSRTPTTAQMVKPKKFSLILALLGLLIAVVGLVIYVIIYMAMGDSQVYLTVDVNGKIHRT
jgi:cell division septal protein FtsQ